MDLSIRKIAADKARRKPEDDSQLGFGRYFSNHLFCMEYDADRGWHSPSIEPYRKFELDPAALVFHYSQEVFDGLKAFRGKDGEVFLFRAEDYVRRLNTSAKRVCIPEIDVRFVTECIARLVGLDHDWVPSSPGTSLYIRPVIIATEASLGVKVSSRYLLYVITCPVGSFYVKEMDPVKIAVTEKYVRAVRGSVGDVKTGGNYAASLLAAQEAKKEGFNQVLWLDAIDRTYLEEVGTMNIFFHVGGSLWTPSLSGSIIPGITRDTIMKMAGAWGLSIEEKRISIREILDAHAKGEVKECFGSGTAVSIAPVSGFRFEGKEYPIGNGEAGPLAKRIYEELQQLQRGYREDRFGWLKRVSIA